MRRSGAMSRKASVPMTKPCPYCHAVAQRLYYAPPQSVGLWACPGCDYEWNVGETHPKLKARRNATRPMPRSQDW